jgi:hypothetical protein
MLQHWVVRRANHAHSECHELGGHSVRPLRGTPGQTYHNSVSGRCERPRVLSTFGSALAALAIARANRTWAWGRKAGRGHGALARAGSAAYRDTDICIAGIGMGQRIPMVWQPGATPKRYPIWPIFGVGYLDHLGMSLRFYLKKIRHRQLDDAFQRHLTRIMHQI